MLKEDQRSELSNFLKDLQEVIEVWGWERPFKCSGQGAKKKLEWSEPLSLFIPTLRDFTLTLFRGPHRGQTFVTIAKT